MQIKIWDKKSDINNVSLETLLSYRNDIKRAIENNEDIFLFYNGSSENHVNEIIFENIVRSNYKLEDNLTSQEVAQKYLEIKQRDLGTQSEGQEEILKDEIKELKLQQETTDKITADLAYELMMLKGVN